MGQGLGRQGPRVVRKVDTTASRKRWAHLADEPDPGTVRRMHREEARHTFIVFDRPNEEVRIYVAQPAPQRNGNRRRRAAGPALRTASTRGSPDDGSDGDPEPSDLATAPARRRDRRPKHLRKPLERFPQVVGGTTARKRLQRPTALPRRGTPS